MSKLTLEVIDSSSDDELISLLGRHLGERISAKRGSPEFVTEIRKLPVGLRAMAATHALDVSLALDDLGWHFGNWPNTDLAEETAQGLEELGASDLAAVFREAFHVFKKYRAELGPKDWAESYHGSPFEKAVTPLDNQARAILDRKSDHGIFKYWVDYARRHPERVGAEDA